MPLTQSTLINFAIVALLVSLIPGPAFITTLCTALRCGLRSALYTSAGLISVDAFYFLLTSAGLGSLLATSQWAFSMVKVIGVIYLMYIGVRSLVFPDNSLVDSDRTTRSGRRAFLNGVTVQVANPKLLLFLAASVPQFVDPAQPMAAQFVILGSIFILSETIVFSALAFFAARARALLSSPRAARLTNRISGVVMLGAAVRIGTDW